MRLRFCAACVFIALAGPALADTYRIITPNRQFGEFVNMNTIRSNAGITNYWSLLVLAKPGSSRGRRVDYLMLQNEMDCGKDRDRATAHVAYMVDGTQVMSDHDVEPWHLLVPETPGREVEDAVCGRGAGKNFDSTPAKLVKDYRQVVAAHQ